MIYTVYYKKKGGLFWRKLKRVKGDYSFYVYMKTQLIAYPVRVITLEDETRLEFPMLEYLFKFSKERQIMIEKNVNKEAGK